MGNIKAKGKDGKWRVVATNNSSGVVTNDARFVKDNKHLSDEDVLINHEDRLIKAERNISWLALHGGGGSGSGSGSGSDISEVSCRITVNGKETNNDIICDENGISIQLNDISAKAIKNWNVIVKIGVTQIASGNASYLSPIVNVEYGKIKDVLINHKGNIQVVASYVDDNNGVYGSAIWNGQIIESIVNITAKDTNVNITSDNQYETDNSMIYNYSVGIVGNYVLKIDVRRSGEQNIINTITRQLNIIDTNDNSINVRIAELIPNIVIGVYDVTTQLYNVDNNQVKNIIYNNITLVSKDILISSTVLSLDSNKPLEINLSGSMNIEWTAFMQNATTFRYKYAVDNVIVKDETIGYFGQKVIDFISVINKDWAIQDKVSVLGITINTGTKTVTKNYYVKFIKAKNSFIDNSISAVSGKMFDFKARNFNNNEINFSLANNNYIDSAITKSIKSKLTTFNSNNLVGIKTASTNAPYLRLSNGAYSKITDFTINSDKRNFVDIIKNNNKGFSISLSFKADYHPDDERTIFSCGNYDVNNGKLLTGIEVNVHSVRVNGEDLLILTDNVVNNLDIVCIPSTDAYIKADGSASESIHYIVGVYLEGKLSAITNLETFIELSNNIFIGGKIYGDNTKAQWLCDCNIYSLQIYNYPIDVLDITKNYINNKVASTYKDSNFDFDIIDNELRKNFCERDADGDVKSYIYNGQYNIDFLLGANGLDELKLNQYAKAVGIPVLYIDVSNDESWTFNNFATQQTASNVTLGGTSGKTAQYWDPTQDNTSIITLNNITIELQGTSTMKDVIKNINITVPNDTVFIPTKTWLYENTYTCKADVVDSSHSSNAAIGRFINEVIDDYFDYSPDAKAAVEDSQYVKLQQPTATLKHTVEGFPILLIMKFHVDESSSVSTTPLGIYSFNLGRDAIHNLGFKTINSIKNRNQELIKVNTFPFIEEKCIIDETSNDATWIEYGDNTSVADLINLDSDSLPGKFDSSTGGFWQDDLSIINKDFEIKYSADGKNKFTSNDKFVKFVSNICSLPVEGLYSTVNEHGTINRPIITSGYTKYIYEKVGDNERFTEKGTQQIITDVNALPDLGFNGASHYKYLVIASLFGLIDNLLKNASWRNWKGKEYYIDFYDLDSALGNGNQGVLGVSTTLWLKYLYNKIIDGKNYGYVGETYDSEKSNVISTSIFAGSHNKLWMSIDTPIVRSKLQMDANTGVSAYAYYWNDLRNYLYNKTKAAGYENFADYFVNEFFIKQCGNCGPLIFNLDYKLKYLVQFTTDKYNNTRYYSKLHGGKEAYTRQWLNKRILFLDSLFYWRGRNGDSSVNFSYPNDLTSQVSGTVYNTPEYVPIKTNTDLILYFSVGSAAETYYFVPANTEIYVNAGNNVSNSEFTWNISNSPQIIKIGNDNIKLKDLNIYKIAHTNGEKTISNPGLTAITELNMEDSKNLGKEFDLKSFIPEGQGVSELRVINFRNTNSRNINGQYPTFSLNLNTILTSGESDSKFTKLIEIDISGSQCISDISLPEIPLNKFVANNSNLQNLNLINQNYITNIDLTGCTKLTKVVIKECAKFENIDLSNLNNLQSVDIVNNKSIKTINIQNCPNLKVINIENNKELTYITIYGCNSLTGAGTSKVNIIDNTKLTNLDVHSNVNLTTYNISNSNQANIKLLNHRYTSITYISGDGADETLLDLSAFTNMKFYFNNNNKVKEIQFANDFDKPIELDGSADGCDNLLRIYGNILIKEIQVNGKIGFFRGCSKFSIHGDDYKALGPAKWNNRNTRDSNNRVKTVWEILSGSITNRPTSGTTRPYSTITKQQGFVAGKRVTNISFHKDIGTLNYTFYGTHITQFDVYYILYALAMSDVVKVNLYRFFYGLHREAGEYYLFNWDATDNNMMNRFIFYKLTKITYLYEMFTTGGIIYILSPEPNYPINNDEDNGVFSPLTQLTNILRLSNNSIIFSNKVFNRYDNKHYALKAIEWQTTENITPDDTWCTQAAYNNFTTSKIKELGNFTNLFNNLPSLNKLAYTFNFNYINYNTLVINSNMSDIQDAFNGNATGVCNLNTILPNSTNLSRVGSSFNAATDGNYGTQAEYPITSNDLSKFTKLEIIGRDFTQQNNTTDCFGGMRKYINQANFPYDIISNNPKLNTFTGYFANCENKSFIEPVKLPGTMFAGKTKMANISRLFKNVDFEFSLTPNGFTDCVNLNRVNQLFYHDISTLRRSKLISEIPYRFFYHGDVKSTVTNFGTTQVDSPNSDFDIENNLETERVDVTIPRSTIIDISECFYGCINIEAYTNKDNQNIEELNPNYSKFNWLYNKTNKTWTKNNVTKQKIAYWGYTGDPTTQQNDCEYLETKNVSIIHNLINGKSETINYMCAPDLLRYCVSNCNIQGLFYYCGTDIGGTGNFRSDEDYYSFGIKGRIPPYLLKPIYNATSISNIFAYCKNISGVNMDGVNYLIPKDFFSYAPKTYGLDNAFAGLSVPYNTQLAVFDVLKNTLTINKVFCRCIYNAGPNAQKQLITKIFANNTISQLTGAFSCNDIKLSGMFDATIQEYQTISNSNVQFKDNFNTNASKLPSKQNIKYVYYGYGDNAQDVSVPKTNNNY